MDTAFDLIRPNMTAYNSNADKNVITHTAVLNERITVEYHLLKCYDSESGASIYCIFVTQRESGFICESEYAYDICRNEFDAYRIFDLICDNTVLPCSLIEILSDIL